MTRSKTEWWVFVLVTGITGSGHAALFGQYTRVAPEAIEVVAELPGKIDESSGLVYTDYGTLIGHNDSGDDPVLYEFSVEGEKLREIAINNAKHKDWEDITADKEHIYIGDFGNNFGSRGGLKIYKIDVPEPGTEDIELSAEMIRFEYADQKRFERRKSHNFDCEAMVAFGDSLYLFTKNRDNKKTKLYAVPKNPGKYEVLRKASFDVDGLITAADIRNDMLVLLGYNNKDKKHHPFFWTFTNFSGADFFEGESTRVNLPMKAQTEAVVFEGDESILFTNEEEKGGKGFIYRMKIEDILLP